MATPTVAVDEARALALAGAALRRPAAPFRDLPPRLLLVDVERQTLALLISGASGRRLSRSRTAAAGVGSEEGSFAHAAGMASHPWPHR